MKSICSALVVVDRAHMRYEGSLKYPRFDLDLNLKDRQMKAPDKISTGWYLN